MRWHRVKIGLFLGALASAPGVVLAQAPDPAAAPPVAAAAVTSAPPENKFALAAVWKDGFFLESREGAFKLHVGGLVQVDGRLFPGDRDAGQSGTILPRRARIKVEGTIWKYVNFRLLPDFAGGTLKVVDCWAELAFVPWLKLRAGKLKVPFGLERLQGDANTAFVERALPTNLVPSHDIGVMLHGEIADETVEYGLGIFNGNGDDSSADTAIGEDVDAVAHLFVHPFRKTRLRALHHLGAGWSVSIGRRLGSPAKPAVEVDDTDGQADFFHYRTVNDYLPIVEPADDNTTTSAGRRVRATAHGYFYLGRLGLMGEYV